MRYLLGKSQMKAVDAYTINNIGIPSIVLMERAALAVFDEVTKRFEKNIRILVAAGMGNNGADGLAVARLLYQKGYEVDVMLVGDETHATEEFRLQKNIIKKLGIHYGNIDELSEYIVRGRYKVCIDAIFGIGLSRAPLGDYYDVIDKINMSECFNIAIDIPSGIMADSGEVPGVAVKADVTVTFGYEKLGMALYPAAAYCGEIIIKDIGFASLNVMDIIPEVFTYTENDLKQLPERNPRSHKGSFGRVLVVAGSDEMSGAAYLSAKAAYRMGAGLVEVFIPEKNAGVIRSLLPEAIVTGYDTENFTVSRLSESCTWADTIVIGPGIGRKSYAVTMLNFVLQCSKVPVVIDADALNIMAENRDMFSLLNKRMVITPHMKEMERLVGQSISDIKKNPIDTARTFSNITGAVCVLKDARTVVTSMERDTYINKSGNEGMATGGSGDVLTGVIAALIAQKMDVFKAAALGVYIHGLAGDKAAESLSSYSMMAGDIAESISAVVLNS